jgi:ATP/maltotriose-dependent transcriptional regulator MalT
VRHSSADVAALALGLARACSTVVEGCEVRLREHLRAVSAPAGSASILAEILCEDLASWPSDGWLVIDDYQEIAGAQPAESFVADLIAGCPLQVVLTSRQRPSWVSARSMLYGEVLEVNQAALAMDTREAAEVLSDWSEPAASGLVALANGWPAVIGLASVSSAEIDGEEAVPESLYHFFAEEVFDALGDDVRDGLMLLAVAPVVNRDLADELLGEERAETVCNAAIHVGVLVERDSRLELHPLARSFLEERGAPPSREMIDQCLAHYRAAHDWDAAFDLIVRRDVPEELEGLLSTALDDLLETARLSTIDAWCEYAARVRLGCCIVPLAQAEIALRRGHHTAAQAYAELAANDQILSSRALAIGGRAAHLASREEDALRLYRKAELVSTDDTDRREALYGQVMCLIELESSDAAKAMEAMSSTLRSSDPREVVRIVAASLSFQQRFGTIDVTEADRALELLPTFADPLVKSAFLSAYSTSLGLQGRYRDCLEAAMELHEVATSFRLDFAIPYALCWSSMAYAGMRQWDDADRTISLAIDAAEAGRDLHAVACSRAVQLRTLAQRRRATEALSIAVPDGAKLLPAVRAELIASRALVLTTVGRVVEAAEAIDTIRDISQAVEALVLTAVVDAVVGLKLGQSNARELAAGAQKAAVSTGALDLLVCGYRAAPELLAVLLRSPRDSERLRSVIRDMGDEDLARAVGYPPASLDDARQPLSPREHEVCDLIAHGLTDKQIAETLVIAVSTAKAHAHRIYEKLGVSSRRELIVRAALERQATSAMRTGSDDS